MHRFRKHLSELDKIFPLLGHWYNHLTAVFDMNYLYTRFRNAVFMKFQKLVVFSTCAVLRNVQLLRIWYFNTNCKMYNYVYIYIFSFFTVKRVLVFWSWIPFFFRKELKNNTLLKMGETYIILIHEEKFKLFSF